MMPDMTFAAREAVLAPGETLFAFTDGVTDARDPSGRLFSEERLLELLSDGAPLAATLLASVERAVDSHSAGSEPSDDITMLAVRRAL
jgi:sigma-B regulation protein RsbU (phosphoserine phosphatase)